MTIAEIASLLKSQPQFGIANILDNPKFQEYVDKKKIEIEKNKIPSHKSQLRVNLEMGLALEVAIASLIGGKRNPLEHDASNWESYAYDVLGPNGERIEIKTRPERSKEDHLRFNLKGNFIGNNTGPDAIAASYYDSFLKHSQKLDFLIVGTVDKQNKTARIKAVFDAKRFKNYVAQSWNPKVPTHYFNVNRALLNNDMIKIKWD